MVPISQLSPKNVFLSPKTSDGVSAQQEKTISYCFIFHTLQLLRRGLLCGNCRLCFTCVKIGNGHFFLLENDFK